MLRPVPRSSGSALRRAPPARSLATAAPSSARPAVPAAGSALGGAKIAPGGALAPQNFGQFLDARVAAHEWRDAFRDVKHDLRWTYKELSSFVTGYAAGLPAAGLTPGTALLSLLPNQPEQLVIWLAAMRCGGLFGATDRTEPGAVGPVLDAAQARVLLVPGAYAEGGELVRLVPELGVPEIRSGRQPGPFRSLRHRSLRTVLSTAWQQPNAAVTPLRETYVREPLPNPVVRWTASTPPSAPAAFELLAAEARQVQLAVHTQGSALSHAAGLAAAFGFGLDDRVMSCLSWSSAAGQTAGALAAWVNGGSLIAPSATADPLALLHALDAERATAFVAFADTYAALLAHPSFHKHSLSHLRTAVVVARPGALAAPDLCAAVRARLHAERVIVATSLPAAGGVVFARASTAADGAGSDLMLGRPVPGVEARLGRQGELELRGGLLSGRRLLGSGGATTAAADAWVGAGVRAAALPDGGFALA